MWIGIVLVTMGIIILLRNFGIFVGVNLWGIFLSLLIIALGLSIITGRRRFWPIYSSHKQQSFIKQTALEELKRRYALGEINRDEYEKMRKDLSN